METFRPNFTYGDDRDKVQRQESRRRDRQLQKDEYRLRVHEKMERTRDARRKKKISALTRLRNNIAFLTPVTPKSRKSTKKTTSSSRKPKATIPQGPVRSASHRPTASRQPSAPRVVYVSNVSSTPLGKPAVRPQPQSRGSHQSQRQPGKPQRVPSQQRPVVVQARVVPVTTHRRR